MGQNTRKHARKDWKPYKLKDKDRKFGERGLKCGKTLYKHGSERQRPTEEDAQWFITNLMNEEIRI